MYSQGYDMLFYAIASFVAVTRRFSEKRKRGDPNDKYVGD